MTLAIRTYHGSIRFNDIDEFMKIKNKPDLKKMIQILSWDSDAIESLQNYLSTFNYVPATRREKDHRKYVFDEITSETMYYLM